MGTQAGSSIGRGCHSRDIGGSSKAFWRVEDLWQKARALPVREVPPESVIDLDTDGWFRGTAPTARVVLSHMKRILNSDLGFPVILDCDGSIMDGAHRVCKAILEGRSTVKVVQFEVTPEASFIVPEKSL